MPIDERDRVVEVVLGTESDDSELVRVLSSELLDAGGFPVARTSVRGPEPHEQRLVGR